MIRIRELNGVIVKESGVPSENTVRLVRQFLRGPNLGSGDNDPHEPQYHNPRMRIARRLFTRKFRWVSHSDIRLDTPVTSSEVGASIATGAI